MATAINSANPVFINCENSKNAINSAVLPRHVSRRCIYDASVIGTQHNLQIFWRN